MNSPSPSDRARTDRIDGRTDRVDGRTARRDRNRLAVLDAVIELFTEDNLHPGVHEVAERSGVSLRSVYRYFEDADSLIASAIERQLDLARPLFLIDDLGQGTLDGRIERFATRRVGLYDAVQVVYRASCIRAGRDPQVHAGLVQARASLREQTLTMFAPELRSHDECRSSDLANQIDVLAQFDAIGYLMVDVGLSSGETKHFVQRRLADALG